MCWTAVKAIGVDCRVGVKTASDLDTWKQWRMGIIWRCMEAKLRGWVWEGDGWTWWKKNSSNNHTDLCGSHFCRMTNGQKCFISSTRCMNTCLNHCLPEKHLLHAGERKANMPDAKLSLLLGQSLQEWCKVGSGGWELEGHLSTLSWPKNWLW